MAGTGLAGTGIGLGIGKHQVNKLENTFGEYNQEENAQIADQAFIGGVQYALEQAGLNKESFYNKIAEGSFNDEIEKMAGAKKLLSYVKPLANKAKNAFNDTFTDGIKKYKNIQKNPHPNKNVNELLTSAYKDRAGVNKRNMAIAGAGIGAGVVATKAMSSKD
jgi:hypothetical protein